VMYSCPCRLDEGILRGRDWYLNYGRPPAINTVSAIRPLCALEREGYGDRRPRGWERPAVA
jgi:hypothetical protein